MTSAPTPANWASLGLLGIIWGGTFMVVRVALDGHGPLTVATARTTLGALALAALMLGLRRAWPRGARVWAFVLPIGLLSTAVPFYLLSWGQQHVPSAFAGLTMAALPLFVLPLAHLFSDEPMNLRRAIGVMLGFTGAAVLIGPGSLVMAGGDTLGALGRLACLGAALSYAIASILTRQCPPIDSISLSALTLIVGAVVLVPMMLIFEGVPSPAGGMSDWAILFLGLMPTALAALIRVQMPKRLKPN